MVTTVWSKSVITDKGQQSVVIYLGFVKAPQSINNSACTEAAGLVWRCLSEIHEQHSTFDYSTSDCPQYCLRLYASLTSHIDRNNNIETTLPNLHI